MREINELLESVRECESLLWYREETRLPRNILQNRLASARATLLRLGHPPVKKPEDPFASFELDGSGLVMKERIGHGSFGVVYKADFAGTPVAVKKFDKGRLHDPEEFKAEIELMKVLRHPNFVSYLGVVDIPTDDSLSFVLELCDADLKVVCRKMRDKDPSTFMTKACKYICQAARGFAYLHNVCHMVHRDIKPANILLKNGEVKISDFGFTVMNKYDKDFAKDFKGSPFYMAPELFARTPHSYPIDVYAFGVTMFEVLEGGDPFLGFSEREEFSHAVLKGVRPDFSRLAKTGLNCPASLLALMEKCWDKDAAKRPLMGDVYKELKKIFIETVVPTTAPAFDFWLDKFGDNISDSVTLGELLNVLPQPSGPEKHGVSSFWQYLIQNSDRVAPVTLKTVDDMFNWYGDLLNKEHLISLCRKIKENEWFMGQMDSEKAGYWAAVGHSKTGCGCFLVRTSKTDSRRNPFTITICEKNGTIVHFRVARTEDGRVGCSNFVDAKRAIIYESDIFELIHKYILLKLLQEQPFSSAYKPSNY